MSRTLLAFALLTPLLAQAAVPLYGQCGGFGFTGETTCVSGVTCTYLNYYYSQCLVATAATTVQTTTVTTKTSTTKTSSTKTSSTKASSTKASSTKTSSTKTSSTKTSTTKTSSTSALTHGTVTATALPSGVTTTLPASAGYSALPTASIITGSFDGGMKRFDRAGSPGDCQEQTETGESEAVFILEAGATISNVIIGKAQAEGIHCRGPCTLKNIWWEDVCEDAATFKQTGAGDISYIIGGGALNAQDKIFQHNGAGTVSISGFYANTCGKLYRSCGNCSVTYKRNVIVDNVMMEGCNAGVGINTNFGDTAKLTNVCSTGKPTLANMCCRYDGTTPGNEPTKTGCGADASCVYNNVGAC